MFKIASVLRITQELKVNKLPGSERLWVSTYTHGGYVCVGGWWGKTDPREVGEGITEMWGHKMELQQN